MRDGLKRTTAPSTFPLYRQLNITSAFIQSTPWRNVEEGSRNQRESMMRWKIVRDRAALPKALMLGQRHASALLPSYPLKPPPLLVRAVRMMRRSISLLHKH